MPKVLPSQSGQPDLLNSPSAADGSARAPESLPGLSDEVLKAELLPWLTSVDLAVLGGTSKALRDATGDEAYRQCKAMLPGLQREPGVSFTKVLHAFDVARRCDIPGCGDGAALQEVLELLATHPELDGDQAPGRNLADKHLQRWDKHLQAWVDQAPAARRAAYGRAKHLILDSLQRRTTWLDLAGLGLESLPPAIGALTPLKTLILSFNNLKAVPRELGKLRNLETLRLAHNRLKDLPPELGRLSQLQVLSLSDNKLAQLPGAIGALGSLRSLTLSNNRLTALPSEIERLARLESLDVSHNKLRHLPRSLTRLAPTVDRPRSFHIDADHNNLWRAPRLLQPYTSTKGLAGQRIRHVLTALPPPLRHRG